MFRTRRRLEELGGEEEGMAGGGMVRGVFGGVAEIPDAREVAGSVAGGEGKDIALGEIWQNRSGFPRTIIEDERRVLPSGNDTTIADAGCIRIGEEQRWNNRKKGRPDGGDEPVSPGRVGDEPDRLVAGLLQRLRERDDVRRMRPAPVDALVDVRWHRRHHRHDRRLRPRAGRNRLVEPHRACGEGVDRRRRVALVAVAAKVVRPQAVHEDEAEVRLRGRGGRGTAEESQNEDWKDSFLLGGCCSRRTACRIPLRPDEKKEG